jgi:hypothetical protein
VSRAIGAVLSAVLLLIAAPPAAAQTARLPISSVPASGGDPEFLPRFDFAIGLEHLFTDEQRFVWDANLAGELDLVDFGNGRVTFAAGYENVLGSEFQPFDPEQGHYTLQGGASGRVGAVEVGGVLHHVSRHLGDRAKRRPIDWNMLGARVQTSVRTSDAEFDTRVDIRRAIHTSFVDYEWELAGDARLRVAVARRVALMAAGTAQVIGTDDTSARGTQYGMRAEGGVRLLGPAAALELFAAAERRIDPYQLEFSTATWLTAGFRLTSR